MLMEYEDKVIFIGKTFRGFVCEIRQGPVYPAKGNNPGSKGKYLETVIVSNVEELLEHLRGNQTTLEEFQ